MQERLTTEIADTIEAALAPRGVFVVIEAEHLCMTMRGVKKPGSVTVTSAVRGLFRNDARTRQEALHHIEQVAFRGTAVHVPARSSHPVMTSVDHVPAGVSRTDRIERLYRERGDRIWRGLLAFAGDPEVASDAVAEAFAQVLRRGDEVLDPERVGLASGVPDRGGRTEATGEGATC